ncbi:unnamed protein product, partial [Phaeothamnion confervicola]
ALATAQEQSPNVEAVAKTARALADSGLRDIVCTLWLQRLEGMLAERSAPAFWKLLSSPLSEDDHEAHDSKSENQEETAYQQVRDALLFLNEEFETHIGLARLVDAAVAEPDQASHTTTTLEAAYRAAFTGRIMAHATSAFPAKMRLFFQRNISYWNGRWQPGVQVYPRGRKRRPDEASLDSDSVNGDGGDAQPLADCGGGGGGGGGGEAKDSRRSSGGGESTAGSVSKDGANAGRLSLGQIGSFSGGRDGEGFMGFSGAIASGGSSSRGAAARSTGGGVFRFGASSGLGSAEIGSAFPAVADTVGSSAAMSSRPRSRTPAASRGSPVAGEGSASPGSSGFRFCRAFPATLSSADVAGFGALRLNNDGDSGGHSGRNSHGRGGGDGGGSGGDDGAVAAGAVETPSQIEMEAEVADDAGDGDDDEAAGGGSDDGEDDEACTFRDAAVPPHIGGADRAAGAFSAAGSNAGGGAAGFGSGQPTGFGSFQATAMQGFSLGGVVAAGLSGLGGGDDGGDCTGDTNGAVGGGGGAGGGGGDGSDDGATASLQVINAELADLAPSTSARVNAETASLPAFACSCAAEAGLGRQAAAIARAAGAADTVDSPAKADADAAAADDEHSEPDVSGNGEPDAGGDGGHGAYGEEDEGGAVGAEMRRLWGVLHRLGWTAELRDVFTEAVQAQIAAFVRGRCAGCFHTPLLISVLAWKDEVLGRRIGELMVAPPPSLPASSGSAAGAAGAAVPGAAVATDAAVAAANAAAASAAAAWAKSLDFFVHEVFTAVRMAEAFDMVADYPHADWALRDLKRALAVTGLHWRFVAGLRAEVRARCCHPGASTDDIIRMLVFTVRSLTVIDPKGAMAEAVAAPIKSYLQGRRDTVRCILAALTDDDGGDLNAELRRVGGGGPGTGGGARGDGSTDGGASGVGGGA